MPITDLQLVPLIYEGIAKGYPQEAVKLRRSAIYDARNRIYRAFAERVAADPRLLHRLHKSFPLTLGNAGTAGEEPLPATLVTTDKAIQGWRVTLTGVANALKWLPNREDLENPPQIGD